MASLRRIRNARVPAGASALDAELLRAGCAFLIGALPFAQIIAKRVGRVDLRVAHPESVSATGVYRVAGLTPFVVVAALDVAKGYTAVKLTGGNGPTLFLRAALVVVGHNWSPFARGAGGRGITPATGVLLASDRWAAPIMLGGPVIGYLCGSSALGSFISQLLLPFGALILGKREHVALLTAIVLPIWAKRMAGNYLRLGVDVPFSHYLDRLMYDRDRAGSSS
ncbi:glycerol-3-phosphate acyltransferase [Amycolatopsis sp. NPDC003865]